MVPISPKSISQTRPPDKTKSSGADTFLPLQAVAPGGHWYPDGVCVTYKQEKDTVRGQSAFHDLQKRDSRLNLLG